MPVPLTLAAVPVLLFLLLAFRRSREQLDHIPTVGFSAPILSYIGAVQWLLNAPEILHYGYDKYRGGPFKIALFTRWVVFVGGPNYIKDFLATPEETLSSMAGQADITQAKYTIGPSVIDNPYHVPILQLKLTRNLEQLIPLVQEELVAAFEEALSLKGNEWTTIHAFQTILYVSGRSQNRIFVGSSLCRDKEWVDLNINYAGSVMKAATIISLFPKFLHPLVAKSCTGTRNARERGMKLMQPIIEERKKLMEELGKNHPDLPNDSFTWLLAKAEGEERTVHNLAIRLLLFNFASLHTTSITFTQALSKLTAESDQYLIPMREEAEAAVREEGWTRAALARMSKMDSFLKESARTDGIGAVRFMRVAQKPFTFSDGTYLPSGTFVAVPSKAMYRDPSLYPDGERFDGFRFDRKDEAHTMSHLASTSSDWLHFGHGKHACPGRFFAAAVLKMMLAHMLINYDMKFERPDRPIRAIWVAEHCFPDPNGKIMIRRREGS